MPRIYAFNFTKIPFWFRLELQKDGIPEAFTEDMLTDEQKEQLGFLVMLYELQSKGLIEVSIDPETGEVLYRPTELGRQRIKSILEGRR